jgi:hypothetical protein
MVSAFSAGHGLKGGYLLFDLLALALRATVFFSFVFRDRHHFGERFVALFA